MLHFNKFPIDHPLYDLKNKDVIGKFKDECTGIRIREFVGLRSKMYALMTEDMKEKKTAKGIGKSAIKLLKFENYKRVLLEQKQESASFHTFRSGRHAVFTTKVTKTGLSAYDNKFYALDAFTSLPYGHYLTRLPSHT
ncbi:MAG TPA: hypothetical protein V6C97_27850 [Oculatellaceae cyanobacterium]